MQVFDLELGALFGTRARMGLSAIMTYAGGAYIHTRKECLGSYIKPLRSWSESSWGVDVGG